jgi:hypothetical protein
MSYVEIYIYISQMDNKETGTRQISVYADSFKVEKNEL